MNIEELDSQDLLNDVCEKWRERIPHQGLSQLKFSDWTKWDRRASLEGINYVGVYTLAKFIDVEVPFRVNPLDKNLIYFGKTNTGKTTSFLKRLAQFNDEAFGPGGNHSGGSNYKRLYGNDPKGLYVSICPVICDNDNSIAKGLEEFSINRITSMLEICLRGLYVYKWGKLPSCNKE